MEGCAYAVKEICCYTYDYTKALGCKHSIACMNKESKTKETRYLLSPIFELI